MATRQTYDRVRRGVGRRVRVARVRLAKVIYPGEFPRGRPAGRAAAKKKAGTASMPPAKRAAPRFTSALDVDLSSALAFFEGRRKTYDSLVRAVAPYIDAREPIFDVGANIGYFTKILADEIGLTSDAHLFEPIKNLADLSRVYLRDVPYGVHVHAYGLGEQDTTSELHVATSGNLGWNTLVAGKAQASMVRVEIPIRRFEDAGIDVTPGFIKIDVEGAEHLVLRGLLPVMRTYERLPVILCEVGWGASHPDWSQELEVFQDLAELGYETLTIKHEPVAISSLTATSDVLLVPRDRLDTTKGR